MTITQIYKQAFKVVRENKVLWAFGLAAVAVGGVGFGSGFSGFNTVSKNLEGFDGSKLGTASANLNSKSDQLSSILSSLSVLLLSIPTTVWVVLGLGVLIALVMGILVSLLLRGWAIGSLIGGTYDTLDSRNEITFATVAMRGRRSFKGLAGLYFFPSLIVTLLTIPFILASVYFFIDDKATTLGIVFIALTVLVLMVARLTIVAAGLWAERLVAIENMPWRRAFWQGLRMFRNNFLRTLQLGIVNCLTGCAVGCLSVAIIGPVVAVLVIFGLIPIIGWMLLPVIIILIIAVLALGSLVTALVLTFKYTTWSILYRELTIAEKENND